MPSDRRTGRQDPDRHDSYRQGPDRQFPAAALALEALDLAATLVLAATLGSAAQALAAAHALEVAQALEAALAAAMVAER